MDVTMGDWQTMAGTPVDDGGEPAAVFAHVSDLHGQLGARQQVYYQHATADAENAFAGDSYTVERTGGIPVLTAALDELRAGLPVCTLMSGDTFHGSAIMTYTDGQAMLEPINAHLTPDIYVPGNWDFASEAAVEGQFTTLMDALDAPVLANNLYTWDDRTRLYDAYTIIEMGELSVGIVGMTNPYVDRMAPAFAAGSYRFGKHPVLLDESAQAARAAGADIVVAVTEIGLPWMVQAAKDMDSVDIMFSAHTHEYTHEPIVIAETETVVVESGLGEGLGRVDLRVVDNEVQFRHHLYCLTEARPWTPPPDTATAATVDRIQAPFYDVSPNYTRGAGELTQPLATVVGQTETPLHRQAFLESGWNTLLNDAVRAHFGADLAVAHGFRYGTASPPGEITLGQLYTIFPQPAPIACGVAYGQQLTTHMERFLVDNFSPSPYDQEDGRVRSYSSNVNLTIDPTAKRGRRLVEMRIDGTPVDPEASYTVATFRRAGDPDRDLGNCGFPFQDVTVQTETTPIDAIVAYLEEHSPVRYDPGEQVSMAQGGGTVQNTPADGAYPFVQPGVDYANGEAYCETAMIPRGYTFPEQGQNKRR